MQLFTRRLDAQLGVEDGWTLPPPQTECRDEMDVCRRVRARPGGIPDGLGPAARPLCRSADRAQLQLVRLRRRRRYPGQLRQGRAQSHAPDLQRHLFRAGQDLRALPPARRHDRPRYRRAGRPGRGLEPLDEQRRRCAEAVEHEAGRAHPERGRDARSDGRCSRQAPPSGRRAMACACPMSTSGGRSPRAATACGASRPITIRPTASPT